MKPLPLVLVTVMIMAASVRSQDKAAPSGEALVAPDAPVVTARTFIPGPLEAPVFTPPAPPVVKPVPAMRVNASVTVPTKQAKTITVIRAEASTLPDLPKPPTPKPEVPHTSTPEELARDTDHRRHMLSIGATIYDHQVSQVHWNHPDTGEYYEALCGFDVSLLGGVGQFVHNGETYSLILVYSNDDDSKVRSKDQNDAPVAPEVSLDSITIQTGNAQDPVGTAPIKVLRDMIASEKSRLIPYQAARQRYQEAYAAWHAAHPPIPRDETFWFKPHRGSRYLKPVSEGGDR